MKTYNTTYNILTFGVTQHTIQVIRMIPSLNKTHKNLIIKIFNLVLIIKYVTILLHSK